MLSKDLAKQKKEDRPFQCVDIESSIYKVPHAKIKVLKSEVLQQSYFGECPKLGSEIDVILPEPQISKYFSADLELRGDECFAGNFLSNIKEQKEP